MTPQRRIPHTWTLIGTPAGTPLPPFFWRVLDRSSPRPQHDEREDWGSDIGSYDRVTFDLWKNLP